MGGGEPIGHDRLGMNCGNEESDEIEIRCDCCGAVGPSGEMASWETEDGQYEQRCEFCTGEYSAGRDDS